MRLTTRQRPQQRKLRKQPRLRRVQAASPAALPRIAVPPTAKKRRRRNNQRFRLPTAGIRQVVTSARWVSLGMLALCIYAIVLVGLDPGFYLSVIPVEGTTTIPASEIVAASGLANTHIFAADPNEVAAAVGQLPGVITATVTLRWPNLVTISIGEDPPIAIWEQAGQRYWISSSGRLVPARIDVPDLLHIHSELREPEVETESEDEEVNTPAPLFISEDVLAGALQLRQLRPNIDRLYYRPSNGLSYQDGRGWRVYFGSGTNMQQKLVVYETIVEDLLARGLSPAYVSVSNQKKPYYHIGGG